MQSKDYTIYIPDIIPKDMWIDGHFALVLHGRYVCKAQNPLCSNCLIKDKCPGYKKFIK